MPWLTRKHGPFEVAITIRAKRLPVGVFPLKQCRSCARRDRPRLSRRDRALRRCAVGRADECRTDHPSAADRHECRSDRAFRTLGHPQGRHAGRDPPRHRRARCRTHRGARSARLWRPHFPLAHHYASRRRAMDVWPRLARSADRFRRLARAHRARPSIAICARICGSACRCWSRWPNSPALRRRWRRLFSPSAARSAARTFWNGGRTLASLGLGGLGREELQSLLREGFGQ